MDRKQAIQNAEVLRRGKVVQDCTTTQIKEHDSISLAKKATRGKKCVALRGVESFRPAQEVESA